MELALVIIDCLAVWMRMSVSAYRFTRIFRINLRVKPMRGRMALRVTTAYHRNTGLALRDVSFAINIGFWKFSNSLSSPIIKHAVYLFSSTTCRKMSFQLLLILHIRIKTLCLRKKHIFSFMTPLNDHASCEQGHTWRGRLITCGWSWVPRGLWQILPYHNDSHRPIREKFLNK